MNEHYVAHSSPKDKSERLPHDYVDHVCGVQRAGVAYAEEMLSHAQFSREQCASYLASLINALVLHDIGKLQADNQKVLRGEQTGALPYDHVDAGVAVSIAIGDLLAAWLVRAHHAPGLASAADEKKLGGRLGRQNLLRGKRHKRDAVDKQSIEKHLSLIQKTNDLQEYLLSAHNTLFGQTLAEHKASKPHDSLATRLLLSCLVDADHGDTAAYYHKSDDSAISVPRKWQERLDKLQDVVGKMQGQDKDRQQLREELFQQCLADTSADAITTCAAPVGLGKTTAVTANLLKTAIRHDLRRIFVIAPFTNVISQTAERLRDYLILDGEDPFEVVAEHHHRTEFSRSELRQYAQRWQAPIVVTTAVQFFETLASASPTHLRKLHTLPGSAVFIDEAHACVPPKLMRQSWFWIKRLAENWSCHFVLASGSLVKFWQEPGIVKDDAVEIPNIFSDHFYQKTQGAERKRVNFKRLAEGRAIDKQQLLEEIYNQDIKGSRLIILNTVQSAAVIAQALQLKLQPDVSDDCPLSERIVLHISTALTPSDRERIIKELMERQKAENPWKKKNWYLAATSCIEAGVDLDFDMGFRERCSVTSFLQTAGRINREALNRDSVLYDFALMVDDTDLLAHPAFSDSISVFDMFWPKLIAAEQALDKLATCALIKEIQRAEDIDEFSCKLYKKEQKCNFQQVQKDFKIIASDTLTAIVSDEIYDKLIKNIPLHYRDIQKNSVQIWSNKIEQFGVTPIDQSARFYKWNFRYDANFLGYMKDLDKMVQTTGWIL